jgi:hypothetical protein
MNDFGGITYDRKTAQGHRLRALTKKGGTLLKHVGQAAGDDDDLSLATQTYYNTVETGCNFPGVIWMPDEKDIH